MAFTLTAQVKLRPPTTASINRIRGVINRNLNGLSTTINVNLPRGVTRQLNNVTKSLNSTNDAARRTSAGLRGFGESAALALKRFGGFVVATFAVRSFISAVSDGIDEAIDFQRELIRIQQVTNRTAKGLSGLTTEIRKLATGLGVESAKLLQASRVLSQTGLSADEVRKSLQALAKSDLAPTFTDIVKTTEGAIAIFRQFNKQAEDLEGILGSINAVAGRFAVESDDIITAVRRTGGAFQAAGGQLEDLIGLFTSVRSTTRESAESIATGFRTIFTRLQRTRTINFLDNLGIQLRDAQQQFVGPFEAIRRLSLALNKLDSRDPRFAQITEELGGFRQVSKVIPLIKQFTVAEQARAVAIRGTTSLTKDSETAQQSLAIQIQKVREEFSALIRSFTEDSTFKAVTRGLLQVARAFVGIADAIRPIVPLIGLLAAPGIVRGAVRFGGGFAAGLNPARANQGGLIQKFNTGGIVPGTGNRDTVPAMLSPGEFVIRKNAVKTIGAGNLQRLNSGGVVKMADGGLTDDQEFNRKNRRFNFSNVRGGSIQSTRDVAQIAALLDRRATPQQRIANLQVLKNRYGFGTSTGRLADRQALAFVNELGFTINRNGQIVTDLRTNESVGNRAKNLIAPPTGPGLNKGQAIRGVRLGSASNPVVGGLFLQNRGVEAGVFDSSFNRGSDDKGFNNLLTNIARVKRVDPSLLTSNLDRIGFSIQTNLVNPSSQKVFQDQISEGFQKLVNNTARAIASGLPGTSIRSTSLSGFDTDAVSGIAFENVLANIGGIASARSGTFDFPQGIGNSALFPSASPGLPQEVKLSLGRSSLAPNKSGRRAGQSVSEKLRTVLQNRGTNVKLNRLASSIQFFNSGGSVNDTVPALLTPGEFVVDRKTVGRVGVGTLRQLNQADKTQKFAQGGIVQLPRRSAIGQIGVRGQSRQTANEVTRKTPSRFRNRYTDEFLQNISFRADVGSYKLNPASTSSFTSGVSNPTVSFINKRINRISSPITKAFNLEDDKNFKDTLSGFLLESYISRIGGIRNQGGRASFDFDNLSRSETRSLNRFSDSKVQAGQNNFIDSKLTLSPDRVIISKAINRGLFDRNLAREARRQENLGETDIRRFNRGGLVERTYNMLSKEEQRSLDNYSANGFIDINRSLRTPGFIGPISKDAQNVANAVQRNGIGSLTLFRGIDANERNIIEGQIGADLFSRDAQGKTYNDRGVVSTSLSKAQARIFQGEGGALLRIRTRSDSTGVRVPFGSSLFDLLGDDEQEVVLPSSKFQVGGTSGLFRKAVNVQQLNTGGPVLQSENRPLTIEEIRAVQSYIESEATFNRGLLRNDNRLRRQIASTEPPLFRGTINTINRDTGENVRIPGREISRRELVNNAISAVNKGKGLGSFSVFRGFKDPALNAINRSLGTSLYSPDAIGRSFRLSGLISTTKNRSKAENFGRNIMEITTKDGAKLLDLSEFENPSEEEVLLQHLSKFRVLSSRGGFPRGGTSRVQQLNRGGQVAGSGARDTVPAMLTPGEFVLNRRATRDVGVQALQEFNRGGLVGMQDGGSVARRAGGTFANPVVLASLGALASQLTTNFEGVSEEARAFAESLRNASIVVGAAIVAFNSTISSRLQPQIEAQQTRSSNFRQEAQQALRTRREAGNREREVLGELATIRSSTTVTPAQQARARDLRAEFAQLQQIQRQSGQTARARLADLQASREQEKQLERTQFRSKVAAGAIAVAAGALELYSQRANKAAEAAIKAGNAQEAITQTSRAENLSGARTGALLGGGAALALGAGPLVLAFSALGGGLLLLNQGIRDTVNSLTNLVGLGDIFTDLDKKSKELESSISFAPKFERFSNSLDRIDKEFVSAISQVSNIRQGISDSRQRLRNVSSENVDNVISDIQGQIPNLQKFLTEVAKTSENFEDLQNTVGRDTILFFSQFSNIAVADLRKQFEDQIKAQKGSIESTKQANEATRLFSERIRNLAFFTSALNDAADSAKGLRQSFDNASAFASGGVGQTSVGRNAEVLGRIGNVANQSNFNNVINSISAELGPASRALADEIKESARISSTLPSILLDITSRDVFSEEFDFGGTLQEELRSQGISDQVTKIILGRVRDIVGPEGKSEKILDELDKDLLGVVGRITQGLEKPAELFSSASSILDNELNEYAKGLAAVRENTNKIAEELNKNVQLEDERRKFFDKFFNRTPSVQANQQSLDRRISTLSGGRITSTRNVDFTSIGNSISTSKDRIDEFNRRLQEDNTLTSQGRRAVVDSIEQERTNIDRLNRSLQFLTDTADQASVAQSELARVRDGRQQRFNVVSDFAFGTRESRQQQVNTFGAIDFVRRGGSINQLDESIRGSVQSFARQFADIALPIFGGQTGRQFERNAVEDFLIGQRVDPNLAQDIAIQATTTEEEKLIKVIEDSFTNAQEARNVLVDGLVNSNQDLLSGLRTTFDKFVTDLRNNFIQQRLDAINREGQGAESQVTRIDRALSAIEQFRRQGFNVRSQSDVNNIRNNLEAVKQLRSSSEQISKSTLALDNALSKVATGFGVSTNNRNLDSRQIAQQRASRANLLTQQLLSDGAITGEQATNIQKQIGQALGNVDRVDSVNQARSFAASTGVTNQADINRAGTRQAGIINDRLSNFNDTLSKAFRESAGATIQARRQNLESSANDSRDFLENVFNTRASGTTGVIGLANRLSTSGTEKSIEQLLVQATSAGDISQLRENRQQLENELTRLTQAFNRAARGIEAPGEPVRRNTGGGIPGFGTTDTVPAMLTPGEFVIRAEAARSIGLGNLNALNSHGLNAGGPVQKFALGGLVPDINSRERIIRFVKRREIPINQAARVGAFPAAIREGQQFFAPITDYLANLRQDPDKKLGLDKKFTAGQVANFVQKNYLERLDRELALARGNVDAVIQSNLNLLPQVQGQKSLSPAAIKKQEVLAKKEQAFFQRNSEKRQRRRFSQRQINRINNSVKALSTGNDTKKIRTSDLEFALANRRIESTSGNRGRGFFKFNDATAEKIRQRILSKKPVDPKSQFNFAALSRTNFGTKESPRTFTEEQLKRFSLGALARLRFEAKKQNKPKVQGFQNGGSVNGGSGGGRGLKLDLSSFEQIESSFTSFSEAANRLAASMEALNGLSIQHQIGGTVEVIINGGEAFAQMEEPMKRMIDAKIEEGINKMIVDKFPNAGEFRL